MAHETRISPEIEVNPDWAAAVRRADGWVRLYLGDTPKVEVVEWSVRSGPAGGPVFELHTTIGLSDVRRDFGRDELDDRWDFSWKVSAAWGEANIRGIREEFAGIKQVLREWADELRAEEATVAAQN